MSAALLRLARLGGATLALATLASCGASPRLFVNKQADLGYYKKIAVVPFANLAQEPNAGERVTRAFMTELVIAERFQVVEPGEFYERLDRIGGVPDAQGHADPQKLVDAATAAQANAIIRGAVTEYSLQRNGSDEFPLVTFEAEMLDVATKQTVWRITVTEKGKGRVPLVGGMGERSFGAVTQQACKRAVAVLRREAF